jgi:nucleoside recognition membrane protein YjiH
MKKRPNLILLSLFWSLLLAFGMTLIGFLHHAPAELTDPEAGGILWSRVLWLFFGWFVFAEIVLLLGGLLYIGRNWLRGRGPQG